MKNLVVFLVVLFISSCIGPVKELENQINDVYFASPLDETPEPLPENFQNKLSIKSLWVKDFDGLPDHPGIIFADEFIYLITSSGDFKKIDATTSEVIFSKQLEFKVSSGVYTDSNKQNFFFIDTDNYLNKIDEQANKIWRIKLPNYSQLDPVFFNNQIILKFKNNNIQSFDIDLGTSLWTYKRQNPPLSISIQSSMLISDNILYSGFPGGKLVIIDPESGAFLSELTASRSKGVTDIDRTNDISGNLVIIDNLLFAVAYNGEMVCFDRASGAKIWNRNVSSYHGLASDLVNIILSHENDSIYSFDKNTGKTVWKNSDLLHRKLSAPLIYDNFILTVDYLGILHVLDLDEGVRQAIFQFEKSFEGLVDFGDSLAIRDTINTSKLYKHKDFVYIILNHSKIIKILINE